MSNLKYLAKHVPRKLIGEIGNPADLVRRQERVHLLPRDELEHAGRVRDAADRRTGKLFGNLRNEAR